jgi:hypothetical protein
VLEPVFPATAYQGQVPVAFEGQDVAHLAFHIKGAQQWALHSKLLVQASVYSRGCMQFIAPWLLCVLATAVVLWKLSVAVLS